MPAGPSGLPKVTVQPESVCVEQEAWDRRTYLVGDGGTRRDKPNNSHPYRHSHAHGNGGMQTWAGRGE